MAMSSASFPEYAIASSLGLLPWQLMWTWMGTRVGRLGEIWEGGNSGEKIVVIVQGVVGVALVVVWLKGSVWWKKWKGIEPVEVVGNNNIDLEQGFILEDRTREQTEEENKERDEKEDKEKEEEKKEEEPKTEREGEEEKILRTNNNRSTNNSNRKKGHSRAKSISSFKIESPSEIERNGGNVYSSYPLPHSDDVYSSSNSISQETDSNGGLLGQSFITSFIEQPLKRASSSNDLSSLVRITAAPSAATSSGNGTSGNRQKWV